MSRNIDVLVVGAGPSGLAVAKLLKDQNADYLVVDKASQVASAWSTLWDSFRLGMPVKDLDMPGMEGLLDSYDQDYHLSRDEVSDLFERYVALHKLNINLNTEICSLNKKGELFVAEVGDEKIMARQLILCIGPRQLANFPKSAMKLWGHKKIQHSSLYKNMDGVGPGYVLVVGSGLSAMSVAYDVYQNRDKGYQLEIACRSDDATFKKNNPQIVQGFLQEYLPSFFTAQGVVNRGGLNEIQPTKLMFNGSEVDISAYSKIIVATGYQQVGILYANLKGEKDFYRVGMESREFGKPVQTINEGSRQARLVVRRVCANLSAHYKKVEMPLLGPGVFGSWIQQHGTKINAGIRMTFGSA